ncbi:hypothetical protein A3A93_01300 [Candidatus Roizmanbacteria bacterium RIFCSPLOWO2_01_FULL_38_12]|uniref:Uncharacterized protein n=1 Tax=Candidatus Roizmanbacteria bacterium RIFCSPLOWO2_01_FULL_38_12 TaxID=1802061 RepID=A0A1F7IR39_9BACT|nr:MAG: hypothetical protein A3F59_03110 [Candidatus Roizmanbacteria bacterium RIFCSPHIGHO2_12_FULL_38_13]OGK45833.1 MAG: hypothetical protein A3A93_01300 [Candidatus Roizmanbacteria bacterium RIFCSPLOWO2_01_FULL_38_12]
MGESSEHPRPKEKKKSSQKLRLVQKETKKQPVYKNSSPLPSHFTRRQFLRLGGATAATAVIAAAGYAVSQDQGAGTPTELAKATAELAEEYPVEKYDIIVAELKALESKYPPGVMPNVEDPEFIKDAKNTLKLTYSMCNLAIPEWTSESIYDDSELYFTQEKFIEKANTYDPTGQLAGTIAGQVGAVVFENANTHKILFNTFEPVGLATVGRSGLGPLSYLRNTAAHEWGHYVERQQLIPEDKIFVFDNLEYTTTDGAAFAPKPATDGTAQGRLLSGLEEALVDEEMREVQMKEGFDLIQQPTYTEYGRRLDELYRMVGQNRHQHKELLYKLRKEGDPIGILSQFSGFADKSKVLPERDKLRWGVATFEFTLRGMDVYRDMLLNDPTTISQVALAPPQPTYTAMRI